MNKKSTETCFDSDEELLKELRKKPESPKVKLKRHPKEGMCLCPGDESEEDIVEISFESDEELLKELRKKPELPKGVFKRHPKEGMCLCPADEDEEFDENLLYFDLNDEEFEKALLKSEK